MLYKKGIILPSILYSADKDIFEKRNESWFEKIRLLPEEDITNKKVILVFGAGHFFGKSELLDLLLKDGFELQKMNFNGDFKPFGSDDLKNGGYCKIPLLQI